MRWKKKVARALESWSCASEDGDPRPPSARADEPGAPRPWTHDEPAHATLDLAALEHRLAELVREQQHGSPANGNGGGGHGERAAEVRLARLEARLADVGLETSSAGLGAPAARVSEPGGSSQAQIAAGKLAAAELAKLELVRAELARLIGEFAAERARIATQLSEAAHEQHRHGQRLGQLASELTTLQDRLAWHAADVERVGRRAQGARHLALVALVLAGGAFVVAAIRAVLAALGPLAG